MEHAIYRKRVTEQRIYQLIVDHQGMIMLQINLITVGYEQRI